MYARRISLWALAVMLVSLGAAGTVWAGDDTTPGQPGSCPAPATPCFRDADADGVCDLFVDANGDGICDHCPLMAPRSAGRGPGYTDLNRNGVCDRLERGLPPAGGRGVGRGMGRGRGAGGGAGWGQGAGACRFGGRGPGFIDRNGDGVCDRAQQGLPPAGGRGIGGGRFGGRGPGYADRNRNGVCDRLEGGLAPVGGRGQGWGRGRRVPRAE